MSSNSSAELRQTGYGVGNPKIALCPLPLIRRRAPTTSDKNYPLMQRWLNQVTLMTYELVQVSAGVATWNIVSDDTTGFPITPYVVGPAGQAGYQTIQAAVTAIGTTPAVLYVQPGTYTENLTFVAGCNLEIVSLNPYATTIIGIHTPPTSGTLTFLEISLTSSTHILSSAAAGSAQITFESCQVSCTNGFTFNLANWTGTLQSFHSVHLGAQNGFVTNSGGSAMFVSDSTCGNGNSNTMVTSGNVDFEQTDFQCVWSASAGTINSFNCSYSRPVTLGGTSTGAFRNGYFSTGNSSAITMSSSNSFSLLNQSITSTGVPAIAGSGTGVLTLALVSFTAVATISSSLTLIYGSMSPVVSSTNTAGASPQTVTSRTGQVAFTDVIANGAFGTLTLTNSFVTTNSKILAVASCTTANSALQVVEITPGSGSVAFRIFNAGSASTAANILVNFWVQN